MVAVCYGITLHTCIHVIQKVLYNLLLVGMVNISDVLL